MLIPSKEWGPDIKKLCTMILERSIPLEDKYQVGLTKIFLRAGMLAEFEKLRSDRLNALATVVQKNFKRYMGLKRYRHLKETVVGLQATFRRTLAQRALKEKAALRIQSAARAFIERRKFVRARKVIIDVQRSKCSRTSPTSS
jgi:myosin-5